MGIKYHPKVKDQKLEQRFQKQAQRAGAPSVTPGLRTPKTLSKKAAARKATGPGLHSTSGDADDN